jgi:hypothetical protein
LWGIQFGDTLLGEGNPWLLFTQDYFEQTILATADGFIPFFDPFQDGYDPCDKNLKISKNLGGVSRASLLIAFTWKGFQPGGFLNSNRYFRIGFGRNGGNRVFRIAGEWVKKFVENGHKDLWTGGPL